MKNESLIPLINYAFNTSKEMYKPVSSTDTIEDTLRNNFALYFYNILKVVKTKNLNNLNVEGILLNKNYSCLLLEGLLRKGILPIKKYSDFDISDDFDFSDDDDDDASSKKQKTKNKWNILKFELPTVVKIFLLIFSILFILGIFSPKILEYVQKDIITDAYKYRIKFLRFFKKDFDQFLKLKINKDSFFTNVKRRYQLRLKTNENANALYKLYYMVRSFFEEIYVVLKRGLFVLLIFPIYTYGKLFSKNKVINNVIKLFVKYSK